MPVHHLSPPPAAGAVAFDPQASRAALLELVERAAELAAHHDATPPILPPGVAGRIFQDHERRLAEILAMLHERTAWRFQLLQQGTRTALGQVNQLWEADGANAHRVAAILKSGDE